MVVCEMIMSIHKVRLMFLRNRTDFTLGIISIFVIAGFIVGAIGLKQSIDISRRSIEQTKNNKKQGKRNEEILRTILCLALVEQKDRTKNTAVECAKANSSEKSEKNFSFKTTLDILRNQQNVKHNKVGANPVTPSSQILKNTYSPAPATKPTPVTPTPIYGSINLENESPAFVLEIQTGLSTKYLPVWKLANDSWWRSDKIIP